MSNPDIQSRIDATKKLLKDAERAQKSSNRVFTLNEAADDLCIPYSTLISWARADGSPCDRFGGGKPIKCDPEELLKWAESTGRTGKPGRPRRKAGEDECDSDYWLGRYRKAKALREEGLVGLRSEFRSILSALAGAACAKIRAMPVALGPSLFGKTIEEIEVELETYVEDVCQFLSDPANYVGRTEDGIQSELDESEADEAIGVGAEEPSPSAVDDSRAGAVA